MCLKSLMMCDALLTVQHTSVSVDNSTYITVCHICYHLIVISQLTPQILLSSI